MPRHHLTHYKKGKEMTDRVKIDEIIAREIIRRYSDGETLTSIGKDERMPSRNTIYRWKRIDPSFGQALDQAKTAHVDALLDMAKEAIDNEPDVHRAKLKADHAKWLAARYNRELYGDRVNIKSEQRARVDVGAILQEAEARMHQSCEPLRDKDPEFVYSIATPSCHYDD